MKRAHRLAIVLIAGVLLTLISCSESEPLETTSPTTPPAIQSESPNEQTVFPGATLVTPYEIVDYQYGIFTVRDHQSNLYGLMDESGALLTPIQYSELTFSDQPDAPVTCARNGVWGMLDASGRELVRPQYEKIIPFLPGNLYTAAFMEPRLENGHGKYDVDILERNGTLRNTIVFSDQVQNVRFSGNEYIIVQQGTSQYVYTLDGEKVTLPVSSGLYFYDITEDCKFQVYISYQPSMVGFKRIDDDTDLVFFQPTDEYDLIGYKEMVQGTDEFENPISDAYICFYCYFGTLEEDYRIVQVTAPEEISETTYISISPYFDHGKTLAVTKDREIVIIDLKGNILGQAIDPPRNFTPTDLQYYEHFAILKLPDHTYKIVSYTGATIIDSDDLCAYESVTGNFFIVENQKKERAVLSKRGEVLVPFDKGISEQSVIPYNDDGRYFYLQISNGSSEYVIVDDEGTIVVTDGVDSFLSEECKLIYDNENLFTVARYGDEYVIYPME